MKQQLAILAAGAVLLSGLAGCAPEESPRTRPVGEEGAVEIALSPDGVTVEGEIAGEDRSRPVYTSRDIVYYESGRDFTYGEGEEGDAHSPEEAREHLVVNITAPGTYVLKGQLPAGQIAVDLGEGAKEDPEAVVTLILEGVDITCTVAPAVIFYEVYECGGEDADTAVMDVDTGAAGANVVIADGSVNNINGSYVARIYKPDTVELTEDGAGVADAEKLHKYDGAFYSRMSMNVGGEAEGTGVLNITAENEGLDTERHLTVNGGRINIRSGNDGINTNEDGVSVTTINAGELTVLVAGETGEGDGIDSNGWLVINGGKVITSACGTGGDGGLDADLGIHINAGEVISAGHMEQRPEGGSQSWVLFSFAGVRRGEELLTLKNGAGETVMTCVPGNDFSGLLISSPALEAGEYTLWRGESQLGHAGTGQAVGGGRPGPGMTPPETAEGRQPPFPRDFEGGEGPVKPGEIPPGEAPRPGAGPGGNRPGTEAGQPPTRETFSVTGEGDLFFGVGELERE